MVDYIRDVVDFAMKCERCGLHKTAAHHVHGRGSLSADLLFVGEAPGKQEDQTGLPFVGKAGLVLDSLISKYDFPQLSYFITNVCCCRPPGNRTPTPEEIIACRPNLGRTIMYFNPRIIIMLGRTAIRAVCEMYDIEVHSFTMRDTHGTYITTATDRLPHTGLFATYHPAATIYDKTCLIAMNGDFAKLRGIYHEITLQ